MRRELLKDYEILGEVAVHPVTGHLVKMGLSEPIYVDFSYCLKTVLFGGQIMARML